MSEATERARAFLRGESIAFADADALWRQLKREDELSLARRVLERLRAGEGLLDKLPAKRKVREKLCQQEALLTSKDPEINAAVCHDRALEILADEFDLEDEELDGDAETLGIAGGIYKRRWEDLGQLEDLRLAASCYERGAKAPLGEDAYAQINAAFLEELLADAGDRPDERRERARVLRQRIVDELPVLPDNWWNVATRAEALLGLGRYADATAALATDARPEPWKLQTTARQLSTLAHLREAEPHRNPELRKFFEALLGGASAAVRSAFVGKVGLALSGGGFRASFYHLGVLARLAELDVLRHVEVLSCVSGGSIVGACYWLALRRRLLADEPPDRDGYLELVRELIEHFEAAVAGNLRGAIQGSKLEIGWRLLRGEKGALDPEQAADSLERSFYRPLMPGDGPLFLHELLFTPADHDAERTGSASFNPRKHNWLRAHKVPVLVLNATTVNTGHAWQFTPGWMGESPWSVHPAADSVPRLEWSWYEPEAGWRMRLARAVAASACVPGVFAPLALEAAYENLEVLLVDGGVYDNQGTAALLAQSCNVVLVSDAAGQLMLERQPADAGLAAFAKRSMDTLMERVRQAGYSDLSARLRSGLLRGFMFLHMKAGLDADTIRLTFSQEAYELRRSPLSPSGVRKEFQAALGNLRTDLDAFSLEESRCLMACGYQMGAKAFERDLSGLGELWDEPAANEWPFAGELAEITSTAATTPKRDSLLAALRAGSEIKA